jgi:hypothetical protein
MRKGRFTILAEDPTIYPHTRLYPVVELSLTMYKNTAALISDAQPLLAAQVLKLTLVTSNV